MVDFEEIKSRVTIEDILIDRGYSPRKNRMACPLHDGDNPTSFSFTDHAYHCFSCGAVGGLLDLTQALLHVDREQALQYLAEKAELQANRCVPVIGRKREIWKRTQPLPEKDSKLKDLELTLRGIDILLDHYTSQIRKARHSFRAGAMEPGEFYSISQYAEYALEELTDEFIRTKCLASIEKKRMRKLGKSLPL